MTSLRRGLSLDDQKIVDRLEKLKRYLMSGTICLFAYIKNSKNLEWGRVGMWLASILISVHRLHSLKLRIFSLNSYLFIFYTLLYIFSFI